MKARTVILVAIVALRLVGSMALAQPGGPRAGYALQRVTLSGGRYRLAGPGWQFSGAASGGRYYLLGPAALSGGRCCCTYLPCVMSR